MNPLPDNVQEQILSLLHNDQVLELLDSSGYDIHTWDTSDLPMEEWGLGIIEAAVKEATVLPYVDRWDSKDGKSVHVPIEEITSDTWVTTIGANTRDASTAYDAKCKELDPLPYRLMMSIAVDSIEEANWKVEENVRKRLANYAALKLDTLIWSCLDGTALSGGKFQTAGESLTNTTTGNAVDYGVACTVDKCTDAIFNIRAATYNRFKPRVGFITPTMGKELAKDSAIQSSSEYGSNQLIRDGVIPPFMGVQWIVTSNIPQDSGSTDIGLIIDPDHYFIGNVPKIMEFASELYRARDLMEFYIKIKAAFAVASPDAGAVLYT